MKPIIKRYKLNENLTKEKLLKNGFKEGGFLKEIPYPKYYYYKLLTDDIELHIEINENIDKTLNFDDNNIVILDNNFCQPYYPFYENENGFLYLNKVIIEYNKCMDNLVSKGILIEKKLEKENDIKKLTIEK